MIDAQSGGLRGRAARLALPWAAGLAGVLFITGYVPCCGFVVFPLGIFGIAYLITPRLGVSPRYEEKQRVAFEIGLVAGLLGTGALVAAALVSTLLSFALIGVVGLSGSGGLQRGSLQGLGATLGLTAIWAAGILVAEIVFGTVIGVLVGFFGSAFSFDQNRLVVRE